MTSRSLYWVKWKENMKRRGWTFALCFVTLFLVLPVFNLIDLNSRKSDMEKSLQYGASAADAAIHFENMQSVFTENVEYSEIFAVCAAFFAILFAVQGFCFLYDRRKLDLYMSVPVSGPKRFVMIWLNGIVMFGLCYLVNLALCWGIGAAFGVMNAELLAGSVLAFFINMLAFTAMYHLALLAVMLVGNVLTALLGCGVFFVYEAVVRMLIKGLKSTFFVSFYDDRMSSLPWLTPFAGYMNFVNRIWYHASSVGGYSSIEFYSADVQDKWCSALAAEAGMLILAAALSGLLSYLLFRKRKTESCHQAIAFPALKPVIEFFLLVPFAVLAAMFVSSTAQDDNFFLFAGGFGGILIGHALIQIVCEKELKAIVRKKASAVCSLIAAALVLCVFRFDLIGFDSYLPKREKIESVSVTLSSDYNRFGYYDLSEEVWGGTLGRMILKRMDSAEPDTIDALLSMAAAWQEAGRPLPENNFVRDGAALSAGEANGAGTAAAAKAEPWKNARQMTARYNLTDGRIILRRFYVDTDESREDLDTVTGDPSYRSVRYQINTKDFEQAVDRMKIVYYDGKQDFLYTLDKQELLAALRKDFEGYGFSLISDGLPCGVLRFSMERKNSVYPAEWNYPVYESFSNTIGVLLENGITAGDGRSSLNKEDVKAITVSYYVYGGDYEAKNGLFEQGEVGEQTIVCTFEDPEEIEEILRGVYPDRLGRVAGEEFVDMDLDGRFQVSISLTAEAVRKHYTAEGLSFLKGGVPDFVKKRIQESAVRG